MDVINIQQKFDLFTDRWSPKRIGELNGQQVILAKIEGEFVFHKHDDEDELFMVMKGQLSLELRGSDEEPTTVVVNPGEFFIVPRGVEHKPTATEETHLLLFEPLSTQHTGDVQAEITVESYEEI
ncbi:MAG: cupin domain-containing protein [Bacillota bacterium]|nr:MAG: cupin domain-containing protein [Planctomycetota bacterium]RUA11100.1 MAG: cupin domain-containing protein [Bacillota bacterium]